MRKLFYPLLVALLLPVSAWTQTADEIIAKYIKTIGGMDKIQALKSLRRTGKVIGGGGFEAPTTQVNQRPSMVREEITIQGLTGITAYDGKTGWKIRPWGGKKDAETLSEDETKGIIDDADFDGPLVNYQEKGNKVEYVGTDEAEGTDTYKLKVSLANGETRYYYMDTDYYVPIKVEIKRMVRGAEQEYEEYPGDYKEVNGVYFPFSMETGSKGSSASDRGKVSFENIEANVALSDTLYQMPKIAPKPSSK